MAQQSAVSVENNFTKGLITEATGLDFPENAATDCDNVDFTLVGDTLRRTGITYETNHATATIDPTNAGIATYKWNNVGGDGSLQFVVAQVGGVVSFYNSSLASAGSPVSNHKLTSTIDLTAHIATGTYDYTKEAQFADGNGYLFIFHPSCDPIYCTYNTSTALVTAAFIDIQIRDYVGIPEVGVPEGLRPSALTLGHYYNLYNQGWTTGNAWAATSTSSVVAGLGVKVFTVAAGLPITPGQITYITGGGVGFTNLAAFMNATVSSYSGTTLTVNVTSISGNYPFTYSNWTMTPISVSLIGDFKTATGVYPSQGDQWWYFKNSSGVFAPATTVANVSLGVGHAPKGHVIISAFQQFRSTASGIDGLTDITTTARPSTGCWFQGRIWYTGANGSMNATGSADYTTWTENIYFSQIVDNVNDFGKCYQDNDPTSEELFALLPTDGGTLTIQGSGPIYKLWPMQNAMIIFAATGVWYLTGSQGVGFAANDYTIVKLSAVRSISSTSFIDVHGLPYFWNAEAIYTVEPAKQGTALLNSPLHVNPLEVNPVTVGTIHSFFEQIPMSSKKYARGDYDPINYVAQWIYRDDEATSVEDNYKFNRMLNFNTVNKAFYPYTIDNTNDHISSIIYLSSPGGTTAPDPTFKYFSASGSSFSFAEQYDEAYVDWSGTNFISYFITGYKLKGQAIKRFQPQYVQVYSRTNGAASAYRIQGIWDYANDQNSNRWSTIQTATLGLTHFDTVYRRHKIRGHGYALQFKVSSADGQPFDIQGWAVVDTVNAGT